MQRMGMVIGIELEKISDYKALHIAVWPHVLAEIAKCNIRNYTIFIRQPENLLFSYWEYHGADFAADAARMAEDQITKDWWALTDPCQVPLESRGNGDWWASMEEVFHHG